MRIIKLALLGIYVLATLSFLAVKNTLADEPANQYPIFKNIGNKTVFEEQLLEFTVFATDPDGDALTYSAFLVKNNGELKHNEELPLSKLGDATFEDQTFRWRPSRATYGRSASIWSILKFRMAN